MTGKPAYLKPDSEGGLWWGPLTRGILLRRYKRFLADVELEDGQVITAHTANTGRMTACSEPGRTVWLSHHEGTKRKHPFTLEMIDMPAGLVGVNTMVPNRLVAAAALAGRLNEDLGSPVIKVEREVKLGHSRLDLRLTGADGRVVVVEVKNCTLAQNRCACFPDAVTTRGARHMDELALLAKEGRAAVLVLVQRNDADSFSPADHIDPEWGRRLRAAASGGVQVWAWRAALGLEKISLDRKLPVKL